MWSHERNIRTILGGSKSSTTNTTSSTNGASNTNGLPQNRAKRANNTNASSAKTNDTVEFQSAGLERDNETISTNETPHNTEEDDSNPMKQYYLTEETSRRLKVLAQRCNRITNTLNRLKIIIVAGLIMVNALTLIYVLYVYFTSPKLVSSDKLWKTAGFITLLNTIPPALAIGLCGAATET